VSREVAGDLHKQIANLIELPSSQLAEQVRTLPTETLLRIQTVVEQQFLQAASRDLHDLYLRLQVHLHKGGGAEILKQLRDLLTTQPELRPLERVLRRISHHLISSSQGTGERASQQVVAVLMSELLEAPQQQLPSLMATRVAQQPRDVITLLLGMVRTHEAAVMEDDPLIQAIRQAGKDLDFLEREIQTRSLHSLLGRDERVVEFLFAHDNDFYRVRFAQEKQRESEQGGSDALMWRLHMEMPRLGAVEVGIALHAGSLEVGMLCASAEAVDAFTSHLDELHQRLRSQGYNASISVRHKPVPSCEGGSSSGVDIQI
jgi:hypothetical protein